MEADPSKETWEHLRLVLAHEYFRCDQAFLDFADLATLNVARNSQKRTALAIFDSYARFLHHLYEFYLGNIKRERKSLAKVHHEECDRIIQTEVEKLIRNRHDRIKDGRAPSWENDISHYENPVPPNFARDLRQTRNRVAHADIRRTGAAGAITLPKFYEKYHQYVLLLYEEPHWLWKIADPDSYEWGEIEQFNFAVQSAPPRERRVLSIVARVRHWLFVRQLRSAIRCRR